MSTDEKKKVLFVAGIEHKRECLLKKVPHVQPENIFVLQNYDSFICHPFDDVMRDILITVYQEGVDEVIVVAPKMDQKYKKDALNKIYKNKELQDKLQTLDYLFKNCMPDFPDGNIQSWLEGGKTIIGRLHHSANLIRKHPLMPSNIKVTELLLDKENEERSEIGII